MIAQMMPGMGFVPLIIILANVGTVIGILAIFTALARRHEFARRTGKLCIWVSLVATIFFYVLVRQNLTPLGCVVIASPAIFGAASLVICAVHRDAMPMKGSQLTLSAIMFAVTMISCGLGLFVATHEPYYDERDKLLAHFNQIAQVTDVYVNGYDHEGSYVLANIQFSIRGIPNSIVRISASEQLLSKPDEGLSHLVLKQLGPWQFHVAGVSTDTDTEGRTHMVKYTSSGIDVGIEGEYSQLLSIQAHSINDILQHYEELVTAFKSWPTVSSPGHMTTGNPARSTSEDYYCTFDSKYALPTEL